MIKRLIYYSVIFFLTVGLLLIALIGVAKIPKSTIRSNMIETAEYLSTKPATHFAVSGIRSSSIDWYADSLLLNIAYNLDDQNTLESVMWAPFSGYTNQYVSQYLLESARDGLKPTQEYLRYWHGSAVIVRLEHFFLNIRQIYFLHALIIAALCIWLLQMLISEGFKKEGVAFLISIICVSIWFVPFCLEYTWVFLVMLFFSVIVIKAAQRNQYDRMGSLFLIVGMVTVYLDFLSTETMTLLIPLLFILRIREKNNCSDNWAFAIKNSMLWLFGYVGMWAMKWLIASIVLRQNVMPYVTGHIEERIGGSVHLPLWQFLIQAITRNTSRLFPFDYGLVGAIIFLFSIMMFVVYPIYTREIGIRMKIDRKQTMLYLCLSLVPYVRYLVLHNHSWRHCNFTYRAQASTIFALCLVIFEIIEFTPRRGMKRSV